ncbi:thiamine phosphate synthase [Sphingobacterium wenxiniae]|uniref:Thiamine-phosphate pyrophosphorylase n=1 Tax=Sphingobacterium wenxiniae TaxID=683125 RepID=A0A1I6Q0E9_9SPHI|nr:thiamine phosphate synthase [Sphingobacterium wenxiniae]SFS45926.1 thiamine-phosphate pyrophosphorylase [Sphingobacterium wenxiniae]
MIIALTPEHNLQKEHYWLNRLLENGLEYCHIRKYQLDKKSMQNYIGEIDKSYRDRLVLHTHHDLAEEFNIHRLHIREVERQNESYTYLNGNYILSTSTHSTTDFNTLDNRWQYAFLSPIYPSISKPGYGVVQHVRDTLSHRQNHNTKLIGLGGVDASNCHHLYQMGIDGIALMGALWQNNNPLAVFLKCKKKNLSY